MSGQGKQPRCLWNQGKQNDVDSVVYDALYVAVVDKGKVVMQTDLALNNQHIQVIR